MKKAYFAGGCFWCIADVFYHLDGVIEVNSGYSGGKEKHASYNEVKSQKTGHRETIELIYDDDLVSFSNLFDIFYSHVDPFDEGGQFIDRGRSYSLAIYYQNEEDKELIESLLKAKQKDVDKEIKISIEKFNFFLLAEDYHQHYSEKNPELFEKEIKESGRK